MMVDGGVRHVLPTQAAIDLGARLLVCVATGVPDVSHKDVGSKANLIDIALRSIDIMGSEVAFNNRHVPVGTCQGDIEMVLIQPSGELHSGFDVNSALIRINLAYGWMRAFDEFLKREDVARYQDAYQSTEQIIQCRFNIWQREEDILIDMLWGPRPSFTALDVRTGDPVRTCNFTSSELNDLRALKRDLFQMVYDRFGRFGETSLPKGFGAQGNVRSETIFDWWEQWEHVDARATPQGTLSQPHLVLPERPFDQHSLWDPNTGRRQLEPSPPQPPIVPADFDAAMR